MYDIILDVKWSQNDNIIVYRNNFLDNLSSSKICYRDRPTNIVIVIVIVINGVLGVNGS